MSFERRFEDEEVYFNEGSRVPCYGSGGGYSYGYNERLIDERRREEKKYQQNERLGELGAVAAGAFALYEGHEAKADPAHAGRHKREERLAEAGALGSGGYALYEHHEKHKHSQPTAYGGSW